MSAAHSLRFMVGNDGESSLIGVAGVLAAVEASLALLGLAWAWLRSIRLPYGLDTAAIALALGAALLLAVLNLAIYRLAQRTRRPRTVLAFLEGEVFPVFRPLPLWHVGGLALLAGLGEEILFRGVLQAELGLWGASLLFGILHGPARALWPLGVWATSMGLALGLLYDATGNLVVPAMAHALYDGAALVYVRRSPGATPPSPTPGKSLP